MFGKSGYGKTVTDKGKIVSTIYDNEDNISTKINSPHFKDLELLNKKNSLSVQINKTHYQYLSLNVIILDQVMKHHLEKYLVFLMFKNLSFFNSFCTDL